MDTARGVREAPRFGAAPCPRFEVCDPVGELFGASKHDYDHVVVGRDKGLGVMYGVERALSRVFARLDIRNANAVRR